MTTCACCGTIIEKHPHVILGQTFGPRCVKKFAGIEAHLELASLNFEYPLAFDMVRGPSGGWVCSPELLALESRARAAGIRFLTSTEWGDPAVIRIHGIDFKRVGTKRIASYQQSRAMFAATLGGNP